MTSRAGHINFLRKQNNNVLKTTLLLLYRPKLIHCNYQFVHYSGLKTKNYSIGGQKSEPGGKLSCKIIALYHCTVTDSLNQTGNYRYFQFLSNWPIFLEAFQVWLLCKTEPQLLQAVDALTTAPTTTSKQ